MKREMMVYRCDYCRKNKITMVLPKGWKELGKDSTNTKSQAGVWPKHFCCEDHMARYLREGKEMMVTMGTRVGDMV